ncbi:hypothetical protein CR513_06630, partial [Mucuna pruriens]
MESDCCQHMKRCMKCQVYTDNIHMALILANIERARFKASRQHGFSENVLPLNSTKERPKAKAKDVSAQ